MDIRKKVLIILALILVAVLSMSKIADYATNPVNHSHSLNEIENQIKTTMELTAGAAATSAAISFMPDDQCTPIAQEIAELAKYFLVVLSALYLEKYLITVSGFVAFRFLIPAACILLGIGIFGKKHIFKILSLKVAAGAIVIVLMVPMSVLVSDLVYENYETSIDNTIDTAKNVCIENIESPEYNQLLEWLAHSVGQAREYMSGLLSHFIEALAVMIVTSCVIPVCVLILFIWIIKLIFEVDLNIKITRITKAKRIK